MTLATAPTEHTPPVLPVTPAAIITAALAAATSDMPPLVDAQIGDHDDQLVLTAAAAGDSVYTWADRLGLATPRPMFLELDRLDVGMPITGWVVTTGVWATHDPATGHPIHIRTRLRAYLALTPTEVAELARRLLASTAPVVTSYRPLAADQAETTPPVVETPTPVPAEQTPTPTGVGEHTAELYVLGGPGPSGERSLAALADAMGIPGSDPQ